MAKVYALSLKQPWAALLVTGRKTMEVRRWPTARRGRILIHAARVADDRPQAWAHVDAVLEPLARQCGGFVGMADLVGCTAYRDLDTFICDRAQHLNEPEWFAPPVLYGFSFAQPQLVPFQAYSGWMRFFPVEWDLTAACVASPSP
jgi:hypothetical protein